MTPVKQADPTFEIAFLFHANLDLLSATLPRCLDTLTRGTSEPFEVTLHCDGTPREVARNLVALSATWGVDEMRVRARARGVVSGDASNNGHVRIIRSRSPYLVVIEDDVVAYRDRPDFDVLRACRELFERHPDVPVVFRIDDHHQWVWKLYDVGPPIERGIRSVNRLSTHFVVYDVMRFNAVASAFGAFRPDVFVDREDWSYNWEDLVSHVATTGGRRIAFADGWPLHVFHCDRKRTEGAIWHTQDPAVKAEILATLENEFAPNTR